MRRMGLIAGVLVAALAGSCAGRSVEGRYVGRGETFFDSLTFASDGKVEIVFAGGRHPRTYELADDAVVINAPNGDRLSLSISSDGCLVGGGFVGTYCPESNAPAAASSPPAVAERVSTGTYEATVSEGRISLAFEPNQRVRVTMLPSRPMEGADRMSVDVAYEEAGDRITIKLPGEEPLTLTRSGGVLAGTMSGETVRFVRKAGDAN